MRKPDFNQLRKVLNREVPDRPVLFELFMDDEILEELTGESLCHDTPYLERTRIVVEAFRRCGYDYATVHGSRFDIMYHMIHSRTSETAESVSLNHGAHIFDDESFEQFPWPEPEDFDYSHLEECAAFLPEGMKLNVMSHCGVLEIAIQIFGYENLCFFLFKKPELVDRVFEAIGRRYVRYYQICASYETVGCLSANDDWGFNTQPMMSPDDLRRYLFPWHRKIVEAIHSAGKPAILHSCGNFSLIVEDLFDLGYDAKHSYQDVIFPVEDFYEAWGDRIAILGGLDVDFMSRASVREVEERALAMLERTRTRGGYALGTGNSLAKYINMDNVQTMLQVAHEFK